MRSFLRVLILIVSEVVIGVDQISAIVTSTRFVLILIVSEVVIGAEGVGPDVQDRIVLILIVSEVVIGVAIT